MPFLSVVEFETPEVPRSKRPARGVHRVEFGYAPFAIVGSLPFAASFRGASTAPDALLGRVVAGTVYPLVFAGPGAGVAREVGKRRALHAGVV